MTYVLMSIPFLVFALVGLLGYSFLEASAKARLANLATNLGALALFVPQGAVLWKVGLVMGLCNLAGGYVGARTAIGRGARFVRIFFLVVVLSRTGGGRRRAGSPAARASWRSPPARPPGSGCRR